MEKMESAIKGLTGAMPLQNFWARTAPAAMPLQKFWTRTAPAAI